MDRGFNQSFVTHNIILASIPRSGSSWLRGVLSSSKSIIIFNEPALNKEHPFSQLPRLIEKEDVNTEYGKILRKGISDLSKLKYNCTHGFKILDILKQTLGRCPLVRFKYIGFKTVTDEFRLGWVRRELCFPKTIFLIRNPFGQVLSRVIQAERIKLNLKSVIPHKLVRDLPYDLNSMNEYQLAALAWRVSNEFCIRENEDTGNFKVVIYEKLCEDPYGVVEDIFNFMHISFGGEVKNFIRKMQINNFKPKFRIDVLYDIKKNPKEIINKWKKNITERQKLLIHDLVRDSDLMKYWSNYNFVTGE